MPSLPTCGIHYCITATEGAGRVALCGHHRRMIPEPLAMAVARAEPQSGVTYRWLAALCYAEAAVLETDGIVTRGVVAKLRQRAGRLEWHADRLDER